MKYRIDQFVGIDQSRDELLVERGYAAEAKNVSTQSGGLSTAKGFAPYAQTPLGGGIGTLAAFYPRENGATRPRLIAVNGGGISEWTGESWAARYAQAGREQAAWLNYQHNGEDILLIADGVRPVLRWNGKEMSPLAGCERNFSELALHYERIWGAGLADEPDSVYWSRAFDPEDWTGDLDNPDAGGGVVQIPTWNGGSVKALRTLFNDVLVFKDDDLYRIVGTYPGNYEVTRVHGVVGPVARNSIVSTANACYFLSKEGLCAYNGVTVAPVGGDRVKGVFARINPAAISGAAAVIHRGILYLALALDGAGGNNAVLEVDLERGAYMLREGVPVSCFLAYADRLLFANATGRVYAYGEGGTHGEEKIEAMWRTPWTDLGAPGATKRFHTMTLFGRGSFRLTLRTDASLIRRRVHLGDKPRPATIPLGGQGRRFTLTIENLDGSIFEIAPGMTLSFSKDE